MINIDMGSIQCAPLCSRSKRSITPSINSLLCVGCGLTNPPDQANPFGFICRACKTINRVGKGRVIDQSVLSENCNFQGFVMRPLSPSVFYVQAGPLLAKHANLEISSLPICSVCMDGSGDCVLIGCGHGGICENCAIYLYQVFGKCPVCRGDTDGIVSLLVVGPGIAHGIILERQARKFSDQIPKVPVGKKKKSINQVFQDSEIPSEDCTTQIFDTV